MKVAPDSIESRNGGASPSADSAANDVVWRQNLSEELRTRLNAIVGFAELLGLDPLPANARSDVRQILTAARDMLGIINRELTPCAGDAGPAEPKPKAVCDILYIEDDVTNVALVERILELRPGLTLKHAAQAHLGLELAKTENPKLILLDLNLPDLNGAEVLQILQSKPETSQIPVVILSANAIPTQIERLLASGARNYLTKPFELDQFLAVVDEWIQSPDEQLS
ncbi:MAG TPA: response regulator [Chthoniobacterales bacterium]|nr:response regulator [Chthoniobacterales bacterium]